MSAPEGINTAMLDSMKNHEAGHSNISGSKIPQTGEGFGCVIGGDALTVFQNEGMDGIFKVSEGIGVPFTGNIDDLRKLAGNSHSPMEIANASITSIDGSAKIQLQHVGFVEQVNFKIPQARSQSEQQH
jgi:hypothetical protein